MPSHRSQTFLREHVSLLLMLTAILLSACVSYFAALASERRISHAELALAEEIQNSKLTPHQMAAALASEVQALRQDEYWAGILRQMSIAFLTSFVIILSAEIYTRQRTKQDLDFHLEAIKRNVWEALWKKIARVPNCDRTRSNYERDRGKGRLLLCYYIQKAYKTNPRQSSHCSN